jgi:hypothetical protein
MRDFLIAILVAAGAVAALPSTSATQTSQTIIVAAPVDDPKVKAITVQSLIEQTLSKGFAVVYSFVWRGEKADACDRMTTSTFRWCLTTP